MPYKHYGLPEYPVQGDLWDRLAAETRPIVVYGMGNGADKLFDRLDTYGVAVADIFASDGFVRGHSFRGMRVLSFSEVREKYNDFVILLSFASSRHEVLEMLADIDAKYEMYIPDMPVADATEYFDREFYNSHYREIERAYNALADEASRSTYAAILHYKLTGRMHYLFDCYATTDEIYSLLPCDTIRHMTDLGAYNGDTVREGMRYFPSLSTAIAVEPDPKTYKRLLKFAATVTDIDLVTVNAAVFDRVGDGEFLSSGNRNSSVNSTASHEHRTEAVSLVTADSLTRTTDYIKYDVEGAEYEALVGSHRLITESAPALLVSLYHRSRDIFYLVNYVNDKYPDYKLCLRRTPCVPAWEIALVAVK